MLVLMEANTMDLSPVTIYLIFKYAIIICVCVCVCNRV